MNLTIADTAKELINAVLVIVFLYLVRVGWARTKNLLHIAKRRKRTSISNNAITIILACKSNDFREFLRIKRDRIVSQIAFHFAILTLGPILFVPVGYAYAVTSSPSEFEQVNGVVEHITSSKLAFWLVLANSILAVTVFFIDYYRITKINRIIYYAVKAKLPRKLHPYAG